MNFREQLVAYLEAITDLEPGLPLGEREDLHRYQQSAEFRGDSRWPGWEKYLGPRPEGKRYCAIVRMPEGRKRA